MDTTAPETVGFSSERLDRIAPVLQGYVDRKQIAGMVALIARHGQIAYLERFGMMDVEAQKPIQLDTIFRIASMTKPITGVATLMLLEEGHLQLYDPIAKFIPGFEDVKVFIRKTESGLELADLEREITIRDLFTHTSGLSYGLHPDTDPVDALYLQERKRIPVPDDAFALEHIIQGLIHLPLAHQPGSKWRYSWATDVLGYLVQVISGKTLDVFLQERIFGPLGMVDTGFCVPKEKLNRLSALYTAKQGTIELTEPSAAERASKLPSFLSGGSGLFSTVSGYARFAQMLLNGGDLDGVRLLGRKTVELMTTNHLPQELLPFGFGEDAIIYGYGFGLCVRVLVDVALSKVMGSVGEFGWDGAFSTCFWIDPKEDLLGVLMPQLGPNGSYPIHQQFKTLTYQALVD
jgi:CubicO group peptidase (beta-lactamase class C family)